MLDYKSKLKGINFKTITEGYTSKCSFIDEEEIKKHKKYMGKRISRNFFRSKEGIIVNADINGAYNILKKYMKKKCDVE